jgi:hypothetical protein
LPKGKAIRPFFGVLEDVQTMALCEGLVVIHHLEVLQGLEDLHSAMNNGVMHRTKSMGTKEKGFTKSIGARPLICLLWIFSNDPWNLLHSAGMVPHLLERERSFRSLWNGSSQIFLRSWKNFFHLHPIVESLLLGTANGIG